MTEMPEGALRALDRLHDRLTTARREYLEALFSLVPFVEGAARSGDVHAEQLAEEVERARVRLVSDNLDAHETLR